MPADLRHGSALLVRLDYPGFSDASTTQLQCHSFSSHGAKELGRS